jgi:hypothetical protein
MKSKPVRLAMASLVAMISLLGVVESGAVNATPLNERIWCC